MNLSLDFDGTYTRDPKAWDQFIAVMQQAGHTVYCVTMRYAHLDKEAREVKEALADKVDGIFFTGRKAKAKFMFDRQISIDVWIDDIPTFIEMDAAPDPIAEAR